MQGPGKRQVVVETDAERAPLAREVLRNLDAGTDREASPPLTFPLHLRRHRGRFLKPCPGTRNYLCCGYHVLNLVMGCPFRCVYCVLQDYLDRPGIQLFVNLKDAFQEVKTFLAGRPGITRIGTGELADSLALEPWVRLGERLVPFFRDLPRGILELKTKSTHVERLLDLPHGGHTVISWSLNPESVALAAEPGAPSALQRLEAARRCQERGYPIGLHFDPMVMVENWEEEYRDLTETVFRVLDPRSILWISLGALRYPPAIHERLFPSGLALEESFPGLDGKMRYLRPLRTAMFRSMARWIHELGGDLFVYLCMESPEVWEDALGWAPRDAAELDLRFQERIALFWRNDRY
jgi:spore photoproduct lyase